MVTTFTDRPSLVKIDARNFRVIVVTDPHRPPVANPQTGPITIHCAAISLARSVNSGLLFRTSAYSIGDKQNYRQGAVTGRSHDCECELLSGKFASFRAPFVHRAVVLL